MAMATIYAGALARRPVSWSLAIALIVAGAGALAQTAGKGRPTSTVAARPAATGAKPVPPRGPSGLPSAKAVLPVAPDDSAGSRPPAAFHPPAPAALGREDRTVRRVGTEDVEAPQLPGTPTVEGTAHEVAPTKATARFEGTPAPGLTVWLDAGGSAGEDLKFLWVQTRGPAVTLPRADAPRIQVTIPASATELAFELLVAGRGGIHRAELVLPMVLDEPGSAADPAVVADAGDDQTAIVGYRVTLNAARSRPRDELAYRWIQIEGPKPTNWQPARWTCTFVPSEPGLYRFLLVVANGKVISDGSEVKVLVAAKPPLELEPGGGAASASIEAMARRAASRIDGGAATATLLARDFDDVAAKTSLYRTYDDVFSEISRRLEGTLPTDEAGRDAWERELIEPLSSRILQGLRDEGLDLDREGSERQPLTEAQKGRLTAIFRATARGSRSAAPESTSKARDQTN